MSGTQPSASSVGPHHHHWSRPLSPAATLSPHTYRTGMLMCRRVLPSLAPSCFRQDPAQNCTATLGKVASSLPDTSGYKESPQDILIHVHCRTLPKRLHGDIRDPRRSHRHPLSLHTPWTECWEGRASPTCSGCVTWGKILRQQLPACPRVFTATSLWVQERTCVP